MMYIIPLQIYMLHVFYLRGDKLIEVGLNVYLNKYSLFKFSGWFIFTI